MKPGSALRKGGNVYIQAFLEQNPGAWRGIVSVLCGRAPMNRLLPSIHLRN
jgi:hypothetical protein